MAIDASELRELIDSLSDRSLIPRVASISLFNATESLASYSTKNAGFKKPTGRTVQATQTSVKKLTASVFVDKKDVPYIEPLYFGSRPHIIEPKNKKSLSWASGGDRIFAKKVQHPGYKGNPFIFRGWKEYNKSFIKEYQEDLTENLQDAIE